MIGQLKGEQGLTVQISSEALFMWKQGSGNTAAGATRGGHQMKEVQGCGHAIVGKIACRP